MAGIVGNTGNFIEEHPYASAGVAVGVVLAIWYFTSGSAPAGPSQPADNSGAAAAVAATNAQVAGQTALAQIAAGVANNQTAATQATAIAGINAQLQAALAAAAGATSVAQYQSQADIVASHTAAHIAYSADAASVANSANATVASEYGGLASLIGKFGSTLTSQQNAGINTGDLTTFLTNAMHNTTFLTSQVATNQLLALQEGKWTTNNPLGSLALAEVLGQTQAGAGGAQAGAGPGGIVAPGVSLSAAQLAALFQGPTSSTQTALSGQQFSKLAQSLIASIGQGVTTAVQPNGAAFHAQ
jgi:hypothetical protein